MSKTFRSEYAFTDSKSAWAFFRKVAGIGGAVAGYPQDGKVLVDHGDAQGPALYEAWRDARCGL